MAQPFFSTLRSLQSQRRRGWLAAFALAVVMATAWTAWFTLAQLPVYAVSESARLEVSAEVHLIQAPIDGRISLVHTTLGRDVTAGDPIIEFEANAERLELSEQDARMRTLGPQAVVLRAELESLKQSASATAAAGGASGQVAAARLAEANADASQAQDEAERTGALHDQGLVSEAQRVRTGAERQRRAAVVDTRRLEQEREGSEQRAKRAELRARTERLARELLELEGAIVTHQATIARLRYAIELHVIRASISGRLGQLSEVHPGEYVTAGDRLAAIVPSGETKVVASFSPSAALGRVRPGQPAHLRLDGFPWTQYGSLAAEVVTLAEERLGESVRVELRVLPQSDSRLPVRHGLPGSVVVEIERVAPAILVMRAAGHWLTGQAAAPTLAATSAGASPR